MKKTGGGAGVDWSTSTLGSDIEIGPDGSMTTIPIPHRLLPMQAVRTHRLLPMRVVNTHRL